MATAVRLRGTITEDGYGGTSVDWDDPDELEMTNVAPAPLTIEEKLVQGRDATEDAWSLFIPDRWEDITHLDRIEMNGDLYAVVGRPNQWESPFSGRRGMVAQMTRITGLEVGS